MSQTRYCSTCGTLLNAEAVICGECGARYQSSPYERRATDAPGAWSQAPIPRSRDLGRAADPAAEDEGVELISRESLAPKQPGATTVRTQEQYDQLMVSQQPPQPPAPGAGPHEEGGPGSSAPTGPGFGPQMEPPLDGCAPAPLLKRFLAALIDSVIASLIAVPLVIGLGIAVAYGASGLLTQILIGVGFVLPLAYALLMIWLVGAKGFSLGKLALGLRVTRASQGGALGFLRSLGRWVLYSIFSLVMIVSIFLDPKKLLRGFHDRAVDSVVVDVKAGRDPLKPRPDDFERASADHYLGDPSVAVSTHQNLLAEPGAAWREDAPAEPSRPDGGGGWGQAAPSSGNPAGASGPYGAPADGGYGQPADGGYGRPAASPYDAPAAGPYGEPAASPYGAPAESPYAPSSASPYGAPAGGQGSPWAPPPTDPVPPPPTGSAWDEGGAAPGAAPGWAADPAPQPPAAGTPSGQPPAPRPQVQQPQARQPEAQQPPPPQPSYGAPAAPSGADGSGGAVPPPPAPVPSEVTGDAWGGEDDGVDEQTRLSVPSEPLGDLEQTRVSPMHLPPVKKVRLTTDDGAERVVERSVVIGRNPTGDDQDVLFVMHDETRSVSKTHLRVDGTGDDVVVTDLGSTNGSAILRTDGSRESLVPHAPTVLPAGAQLTVGDRTLSVEREQ